MRSPIMASKIVLLVSLLGFGACANFDLPLQLLIRQHLGDFQDRDLDLENLLPLLEEKLSSYDLELLDGFGEVHPDWGLNTTQLIEQHGYPAETHTVTTKDGYLLDLHRIPHGKVNNVPAADRKVVLVMPGILCSSADWVLNGPGSAIAYLLAEEGYDVWLGNPRGTTCSRKHLTLNPKDKHFWDFSFHEMGIFDLPAIIDYILEETQQPDLYYIAHSQGSTSFFVMASELPEYNSKVRMMSALAPVTYSSNVKSPAIKLMLPQLDELIVLLEKLGIYELLRHTPLMTRLGQALCNDDASTQKFCSLVLFAVVGFNGPQLNKTMLPVILSNFPAGASVKQLWHFGQLMNSDGKFQQYDYGAEQNLKIYGSEEPPQYDLSKTTVPVAVYYSKNDWVAADKDIRRLASVLPNVVREQRVKNLRFNHMDYMWAIDVKKLVYDFIIQDLKKH